MSRKNHTRMVGITWCPRVRRRKLSKENARKYVKKSGEKGLNFQVHYYSSPRPGVVSTGISSASKFCIYTRLISPLNFFRALNVKFTCSVVHTVCARRKYRPCARAAYSLRRVLLASTWDRLRVDASRDQTEPPYENCIWCRLYK